MIIFCHLDRTEGSKWRRRTLLGLLKTPNATKQPHIFLGATLWVIRWHQGSSIMRKDIPSMILCNLVECCHENLNSLMYIIYDGGSHVGGRKSQQKGRKGEWDGILWSCYGLYPDSMVWTCSVNFFQLVFSRNMMKIFWLLTILVWMVEL